MEDSNFLFLRDIINLRLLRQAKKAARELVNELKLRSLTIVLGESCTAGLVSSLLAGVPGASLVLWGSFICYAKDAKITMLGMKEDELMKNALVSGETASQMALLLLEKTGVNVAASVTGLAGPTGDGSDVPVGTVWTAAAFQGETVNTVRHLFKGGRNTVRIKAAIAAIETIKNCIMRVDNKK